MPRRTAADTDTSKPYKATFIRALLACETFTTVVLGAAIILYPKAILAWAKPKSSLYHSFTNPAAWAPSDQAAVLLQWIGALIIAAVTPLVSSFANGPGAVEKRIAAYQTMLVWEIALAGAMIWQLLTSAEMTRAISDKALVLCTGVLCGPMLLRLYCLFLRPNVFGQTMPVDHEAKRVA